MANKAKRIAEPDSGDLEEMELVYTKPPEVVNMVKQGDITALSSVTALSLALNPSFVTGKTGK